MLEGFVLKVLLSRISFVCVIKKSFLLQICLNRVKIFSQIGKQLEIKENANQEILRKMFSINICFNFRVSR